MSDFTDEEILVKYEPMIYKIVNGTQTNSVVSKEDLLQEGRLALLNAYRTYDESKGTSFSTWAYCLIFAGIKQFKKENFSSLSGGDYMQAILNKYGYDVTDEELRKNGVSERNIQYINAYKSSLAPLDAYELSEVIPSDDYHSSDFIDISKYLNKQELQVVDLFYYKGLSRAQIYRQTGIDRKKVANLLRSALNKLRNVDGIEEYYFSD